MIKAVLLDLDDTLLGNPTEPFIQTYLALLSGALSQTFPPAVLEGVMQGTAAVARKRDPLRTNEEAFYEVLAPRLPVSREAFDAPVAEFYRTVFPRLRAQTQLRPFVRGMVEWLIGEGYQVVVATNPFFPRVAIEQRLAWAGLPVDVIPFALVTTLENMHFCKPHPEYYEEILARLGVRNDEAIMVGDDWHNDIAPAWRAGLNTYWAPAGGAEPDPAAPVVPDGIGTMEQFARLVQDDGWLRSLSPRPLTPDQIAPRLTGNVAALLGVAREAPPHVWTKRPGTGEPSPVELVAALELREREVNRPRLETIIREDDPPLAPPPDVPLPDPLPEGWSAALAFAAERQRTLDLLAALPDDAWMRPARHHTRGATTLLAEADRVARHDRQQIARLVEVVGRLA